MKEMKPRTWNKEI